MLHTDTTECPQNEDLEPAEDDAAKQDTDEQPEDEDQQIVVSYIIVTSAIELTK